MALMTVEFRFLNLFFKDGMDTSSLPCKLLNQLSFLDPFVIVFWFLHAVSLSWKFA